MDQLILLSNVLLPITRMLRRACALPLTSLPDGLSCSESPPLLSTKGKRDIVY